MVPWLLLSLALAAAGFVLWRRTADAVTVWEWETGLQFRNGRFERTVPPGRYVLGVLGGAPGRTVLGVLMGQRRLAVPLQDVLTADGFPVKLGAVVEWHVTDAHAHHVAQAGQAGPDPIHLAVQLALRALASARTLDALLAARAEPGVLDAELRPAAAAAVATQGGALDQVALRDFVLPAEVRRMVTDAERARREGLAALERARGEQAALRALANAARLMRGNPELQTLRALQATAGRGAPTLVLGVPGAVPVAAGDAPPDAGT